jgi:hypothetical protein
MARHAPSLPENYVHALHIMNGTPKAAAMFVLAGEQGLTGSEIHAEIVEIIGSSKRVPHKAAFRSYGLETLVPHGFAERREESYNRRTSRTRFTPTQRGNELGFAAATCTLTWEAETGISLSKILGESASREDKNGLKHVRKF